MSSQLRSLDGANPYEVLGVASDADNATIMSAHRRLIREKHPDAPGGSEEAAKLLNAARDVLLNGFLRHEYDAQVREAAYTEYLRAQPSPHDTWASYHAHSAAPHESPNATAWDAAQRPGQYDTSYSPADNVGNGSPTRWSGWAVSATFLALVFPPAGFIVGMIAYHVVRYDDKRGRVLAIVAVITSLVLLARAALRYGTLFAIGGFPLYLGLTLFAVWVTWRVFRRFR